MVFIGVSDKGSCHAAVIRVEIFQRVGYTEKGILPCFWTGAASGEGNGCHGSGWGCIFDAFARDPVVWIIRENRDKIK